MAIMLAKTYAALKAAGAPEGDAVAAAEELADYENRLTSIDSRLALIEGRLAAVEARFHQSGKWADPVSRGRQFALYDADWGARD
jgi:hypothetical protein